LQGRIRIRVKAPFGDITVEGDEANEILNMLKTLPLGFTEQITDLVSTKLAPPAHSRLEGIVEFTTEGPVITTRAKFTHYEGIGLVLYASEGKTESANKIDQLLLSSGVKSMVPARLNEMTKRGLVFKPDPGRPQIRLTTQGERWIEDEVIPKLRKKI
jgi:hypothetical protein